MFLIFWLVKSLCWFGLTIWFDKLIVLAPRVSNIWFGKLTMLTLHVSNIWFAILTMVALLVYNIWFVKLTMLAPCVSLIFGLVNLQCWHHVFLIFG